MPPQKAACPKSLHEYPMVPLGLVGVRNSKFSNRLIECSGLSQIAGDARRVAGACMGASEHPSTQLHILEPVLPGHFFDVDFHAHIAELAKIKIVTVAVAGPAEKNIAG